MLLLHILSEAAPASESSRPSVRALASGGGSIALGKWYCGKVARAAAALSEHEGPRRALAAAAGGLRGGEALSSPRAAVNASAQCEPEVEAALQALPTCRAVHIFESCHPIPSPVKVCASCAPKPSACPALGHAAVDGEPPPAPSHDHWKATETEELDEFGEALKRRFTDMSCHLYPDETELCVYNHAICYDGSHVVLSVPIPPKPSKGDPSGNGNVLGDPTGGCYDYRYYEPSAIEYSACKFDLFKFNRFSRYTPVAAPSAAASANATLSPSQSGSPARPSSRGAPASGGPDRPGADPSLPRRRPNVDWALPLSHRRWGPINRGAVRFRELSDVRLLGARPKGITALPDGALLLGDKKTALEDWRRLRSAPPPPRYAAGFHADTDPTLARLKALGVGIDSVTRPPGGNLTIYWMDGALWAMAMDPQFDRHIYHATTRLMALYHAQRANRSHWGEHEGDGFLPPLTDAPISRGYDTLPPLLANHPLEATFPRLHRLALAPGEADALDLEVQARWRSSHGNSISGSGSARVLRPNRVSYASANGWDVPPQDYVVLTGSNIASPAGMIPFLRHVSAIVSQPQTTFLSGPALAFMKPNTTLLCAKRGAVTGTHPRLFVNRADAWMFRRYAYEYAGAMAAGLHPHKHHPPRKITVLVRKSAVGRNFENQASMLAAVAATGVPYEVVESMGDFTFKEQVIKMASTGILIAAHGAALVNSMFLPQHAVVIELFPFMLKKLTYFNLAGLLGLWYLPVFSTMPTLTGPDVAAGNLGLSLVKEKAINGLDFMDGCVRVNMSSVDSLLHHRCNSVSKALPIKVDVVAFAAALREAVDIIAAFSAANSEWEGTLSRLKGSPEPSPTRTPSRAPAASKSAAAGSTKTASRGASKGAVASKSAVSATASKSKSHAASKSKSHAASSPSRSHTPTASKTPPAVVEEEAPPPPPEEGGGSADEEAGAPPPPQEGGAGGEGEEGGVQPPAEELPAGAQVEEGAAAAAVAQEELAEPQEEAPPAAGEGEGEG